MAIVVPNTAEVLMLQIILNMVGQDGGAAPSGGNRILRLFTSDTTPSGATVLAELTEPGGSTGYTPITLTGTSWTTTITNGYGLAFYSQRTFTFTTAVTAYGYYVTTAESTPQLLWVERFTDATYTLPDGGGEIGVTPRFTLTN